METQSKERINVNFPFQDWDRVCLKLIYTSPSTFGNSEKTWIAEIVEKSSVPEKQPGRYTTILTVDRKITLFVYLGSLIMTSASICILILRLVTSEDWGGMESGAYDTTLSPTVLLVINILTTFMLACSVYLHSNALNVHEVLDELERGVCIRTTVPQYVQPADS